LESLVVAGLVGTTLFVVSVAIVCMGIIRPFRYEKNSFMRDVIFLICSIMLLTSLICEQRMYWYHGLSFVCLCIVYVIAIAKNTSEETKYDCNNHVVAQIRSPSQRNLRALHINIIVT
jgi:Ca2+/Na+ antiporter